MVTRRAPRLWTVDEYEHMVEAGILGKYDKVELIEGEILEMPPIGLPHSSTVARLTKLLIERLGDRAVVSPGGPIQLRPRSMPEPDLVVLRPREDFYAGKRPDQTDVLFLVEVSDTSLAYDRRTKLPMYGRHGVREVWIVHVNAAVVEVYRDFGPGGRADPQMFRRGETIVPDAAPDLAFGVEEILG